LKRLILEGKVLPEKVKQKLHYAKKKWREALPTTGKTVRQAQQLFAYNVQVSNNQYIVNYSLHQNPTDTTTLA
jgi:hypothetical protein